MKKNYIHSLFLVCLLLFAGQVNAQCDFVNDITGLALSTPPSGAAADPAQFTQTYVLVDDQGNIVATNSTPDFYGLTPGLYAIYAVNFDINETSSVNPLLTIGSAWNGIPAYSGCLDYTGAYGGCYQSVCDEITADENATITNTTSGFSSAASNTQEYCLVCGGTVLDVNNTGTFDLSTYPAATAGADCEVVAMNYLTADGAPVSTGDNWSTSASAHCGDCWDYVARNLLITTTLPVEFLTFEGTAEGRKNRLDWTTLTELNCDHFIVERSHDAATFEPIGKVNGAGMSEEELDYVFYDEAPEENVEYYRLKQVDYDGNYKYTSIVSIVRTDIIDFSVFPNPASNMIVVQLHSDELSAGTLSILDAKGAVVHVQDYGCSNTNSCQFTISLDAYRSGMYCVLIQDNVNSHTYKKRFVKK